eukprot:203326_1
MIMQNKIEAVLLNDTDEDIKLELGFSNQNQALLYHKKVKYYSPPLHIPSIDSTSRHNMSQSSSSFIQNHLSSNDLSSGDDSKYYHKLEISSNDFHEIEINFYPGFAERNAFLGHFKSKKHKNKNKNIYHDHTPLPNHEHNNNNNNNNNNSYINTLNLLSKIPVGSRLRFINF